MATRNSMWSNGSSRGLWTVAGLLCLCLCLAESFALPSHGGRVAFAPAAPALSKACTATKHSNDFERYGAPLMVARGGGGSGDESDEGNHVIEKRERPKRKITTVRASRRGALGAAGKLALLSLPVAAATWSGVASATAAGAPAATAAAAGARAPETLSEVLRKAGRKAVGGGKSGAAAGVLQVISLMWLRTAMNYQYRYGGSTKEVLAKLYEEGGVSRFYKGVGFALVQQPLSRFGDTAANAGMVVLLDSFAQTQGLPALVKTSAASAAAAGFRVLLMPVDTCKTTLQVDGAEGLPRLLDKVRGKGPGVLFEGSAATLVSTFVGHYPWFATYNTLQASVPSFGEGLPEKLVRNAVIGLCASSVSDCCSNAFRVIKTTKQTAPEPISYTETVKSILQEEGGVRGLLGRGLKTRLITNGLQGMLFSVVWKLFDELWKEK